MNKYKYFMNGMFDGTDGKTYEIEVPSPFLYDSESEAIKDSELKYRIILTSRMIEPELAVINKEKLVDLSDDFFEVLPHEMKNNKKIQLHTNRTKRIREERLREPFCCV